MSPEVLQAGLDPVSMYYIAVGLLLIASILLKPKIGNPLNKSTPTTLTERGAFISWYCGTRQPDVVFAWAGDREIRKEKTEGGKGFGSSPKQDVFYESGWHQIGVGPVYCLHEIRQRGCPIFTGPISAISHPSGSTIDLGSEGSFEIYWGEEDQPINTYLGDASRVTISSRWPLCCYVLWRKKRLGNSANWPQLEYVLEARTTQSVLTGTPAEVAPTTTLDGVSSVLDSVTAGGEGVGFWTLLGDFASRFPPKSLMRLTGNAASDQDLTVFNAVTRQVEDVAPSQGSPPPPGWVNTSYTAGVYHTETDIYPEGGIPGGADAAGTLQAYTSDLDSGMNPGHCIAEMLFAEWPRGLGKDTSRWDIDSLEEFAATADTEGVVTNWVSTGGDTVEAVLGSGLQDMGYMLPIDTMTGLMKFQKIRQALGVLPNIPSQMQLEPKPELRTKRGPSATKDRIIFEFSDRSRNFKPGTIGIDADGQAFFSNHQRARKAPMPTITTFAAASVVAERRSSEELGSTASAIKVFANRGARELIPGQQITVAGLEDVMILSALSVDPLSGKVELELVPDYYGASASTYTNNDGGETNDPQPVLVDAAYAWFEVPESQLFGDPMTIIVPHIRAHDQIIGSNTWLSRDNTSYSLNNSDSTVQTGGTLDAELSAGSRVLLEQGPSITMLGPAIDFTGKVLDLSSSTAEWRAGRQLCLIASSAGREFCFLREVTSLGGDVYRLDGLIRARFDSQRLTHPAGAQVFIFEDGDIQSYQDVLLEPNQPLFVKPQPISTAGLLPLTAIAPYSDVLNGRGVRPMNPVNLRVDAPTPQINAYETGDDVTLRWAYRSSLISNTGAGDQSAGVSVSPAPVDGSFNVRIYTIADALLATFNTSATSYTLTNAEIISLLGGELDFKVQLQALRGGWLSSVLEITVESI